VIELLLKLLPDENTLQNWRISDLQTEVARLRRENESIDWDARRTKDLANENLELKLRLTLLVRLLITKGVFTAREYADLIAGTRTDAADRDDSKAEDP
jgi:hypothetical protein